MNKYYLISYFEMVPPKTFNKVLKRILYEGTEPVMFMTGMNHWCYPIALSPLTKKQFRQMQGGFETIEVVKV